MADSISNEESKEIDLLKDEALRRGSIGTQLEFILLLYIMSGILIAIGALAYFGFSFLKIELTTGQRMSLILAGAGASISAMSAVLLAIRRQQRAARLDIHHNVVLEHILVREWVKFEENGRRVLKKKGIFFNAHSPRSIVSMLEKNDLISHELSQDISIALSVRNRVVHQAEPVPQFEVQEARRILTEANAALSQILNDEGASGEELSGRASSHSDEIS